MKTQSDRSPFLLPTIAGIVAIVLGIAVVARIIGWLPNPIGGFGGVHPIEVLSTASAEPREMALEQAPGNVRTKWRCPECGVIVSMREIDADGPDAGMGAVGHQPAGNESEMPATAATRYEFTVRLQGGSHRTIRAASPESWRLGERVIIIDGASPDQR